MPNKKDAKNADEFGLRGRSNATHVDGNDMDNTWRNKGSGMHGIDLDETASLREDEKMREAHRKIVETGGMSLSDLDLEGKLPRHMKRGVEQAATNVAQDLMHQSFNNQTPDEAAILAESYGGRQTATDGSWKAQKFSARIKGMQQAVPVWKVIDEDTSMEVPTVFRVQEPADRAAAILNESGNLNDPRFKNLIKAYNQHVVLMKESRKLRRAIKEGKQALRPKLQEILGELEAVNYKLGI